MAPQPQPPWHADQTLDVNGQIRVRSFALATLDAAGQPVWEYSDSWTEYSTLHAELGVVNAHHRLDSNGRHTQGDKVRNLSHISPEGLGRAG